MNWNFHVSLMLVLYFELTNIYTERQKNFEEYILIFFLTFLAYNYLRKKEFIANKQLNLFLTPIYFIGIVYTSIYFFYLDLFNKILIVFLTGLIFFYKNPYNLNNSLRRNPIIKIEGRKLVVPKVLWLRADLAIVIDFLLLCNI